MSWRSRIATPRGVVTVCSTETKHSVPVEPVFRVTSEIRDVRVDFSDNGHTIRDCHQRGCVVQVERPAGGQLENDQIGDRRDPDWSAADADCIRALDEVRLPLPFADDDIHIGAVDEQ